MKLELELGIQSFLIQVSVDLWSGEACSEFKTDRRQELSDLKLLCCHVDLEHNTEVFQDLFGKNSISLYLCLAWFFFRISASADPALLYGAECRLTSDYPAGNGARFGGNGVSMSFAKSTGR